jgi:hypothetical protein
MKLDLNAAQQLVADLHAAVAGGDVPIERQAAHVTLIQCLPALVEVAIAAQKLVDDEGVSDTTWDGQDLIAKLKALKELP